MAELVLVLGATGNTGAAVVAELAGRSGVRLRTATRSANPPTAAEHVRFDWFDHSTFSAPLQGVDRIYLVAPLGEAEPERHVEPFLEAARRAGVARVVFLSSSAVRSGDPGLGRVDELIRASCAEWEVLRPSWFMQNFTGEHPLADSIRERGEFVTATGDGRVAFVDAADVGRCAAALLERTSAGNDEHLITGPEALSYSEAAAGIATSLGRPVRHVSVDVSQYTQRLMEAGYDPAFARALAALDEGIRAGEQAEVTDTVERLTGRRPTSLGVYLQRA